MTQHVLYNAPRPVQATTVKLSHIQIVKYFINNDIIS